METRCQFLGIVLFCIAFNLGVVAQKEETKSEPTAAYKQQIENLANGIYFRAVGNEPEWSLKISEKRIEFNSLKLGFESFNSVHVEPVRAMDANVKMYRVYRNWNDAHTDFS